MTDKAHAASGDWLARRWLTCQKRKAEAGKALQKTGKDLAFLRKQWDLQVAAQTKPMPRMFITPPTSLHDRSYHPGRLKNKGRQAVMAILILDTSIASEQALVKKLDKLIALGRGDFLEVSDQLTETNKRLQRAQDCRRSKLNSLGISDTSHLACLRDNVFLRSRMNALAIKERLRDKLRQRKFELEKLERSYCRTVNGKPTHPPRAS